jgi:hypothetical protein
MSFPIVNTPFPRNYATSFGLHFFSNRGILLHPKVAGNYPRIPGITLGLCLVHFPLLSATHQSSLLEPLRRSAPLSWRRHDRATNNMSQFRWHHMRRRRILLRRPAGLSFTVDDPMRRSHRPRAYAPSRQQCCEVNNDDPMQFAFADPLRLPTPIAKPLLLGRLGLFAGFPLRSGPRVRHSGDEKFGQGWEPGPTVVPSAS